MMLRLSSMIILSAALLAAPLADLWSYDKVCAKNEVDPIAATPTTCKYCQSIGTVDVMVPYQVLVPTNVCVLVTTPIFSPCCPLMTACHYEQQTIMVLETRYYAMPTTFYGACDIGAMWNEQCHTLPSYSGWVCQIEENVDCGDGTVYTDMYCVDSVSPSNVPAGLASPCTGVWNKGTSSSTGGGIDCSGVADAWF